MLERTNILRPEMTEAGDRRPASKAAAAAPLTVKGDAMDESSERHLLDALEGGDRQAAEELVEGTYAQIYAALFRLTGGDAELAADLTQETYRKAWRSLNAFQRKSRFGTWLYRIAYNTYLNHGRRPRPVEALDAAALEIAALAVRDPRPDQDELLGRQEIGRSLRAAVSGLPDNLRFTITARFWGELSVPEIARLESVSGAAIRKRLRKAVECLRALLEGETA